MKSFYALIKSFKVLAYLYGQYISIKKKSSIDSKSNKIPWYTYPCIEYLNNIDFKSKNIFEYGSGNSSIYWSKNAASVTSIESDIDWYNKIKSEEINFNLQLRDADKSYEESITESQTKYDVIIIDGNRRNECSRIISRYCNIDSNAGFMFILDNSDRYTEICAYFRNELNLIEIDFHGFGPINNYIWTTSIFISRNFNFKPKKEIQPIKKYQSEIY